jgi:hypothetical protein
VRSGPGETRSILLFHTISARPLKQPRMVGSTLGVYSFGLIFVSARTNKRHHHNPHGKKSSGLSFRFPPGPGWNDGTTEIPEHCLNLNQSLWSKTTSHN